MNNLAQEVKYKKIITVVSIVIPIAVAALFGQENHCLVMHCNK